MTLEEIVKRAWLLDFDGLVVKRVETGEWIVADDYELPVSRTFATMEEAAERCFEILDARQKVGI